MLTLPEKGNNIAITADYVGGTADISSLISGRKVRALSCTLNSAAPNRLHLLFS
jgi:hypothetical protein